MKNILMIGSVLMTGFAGFSVLPAQEPVVQTKDATGKVVASAALIIKRVTGAPFSAVQVTTMTQTLPDGNRIVRTFQVKLYRDSQGRERTEQEPTMAVLGEQVAVPSGWITDPVADVTYNIDSAKKTAQKRAGRHASLAFLGYMASPPRSAVVVKEQLPPDKIEGVYAQGSRTTTTLPAGQIGNDKDLSVVDETWYSPDLQLNVMTRHIDPRAGETVYKLTSISRSEPDPALFQVPAGFTVTEPRPVTFMADPPPALPPPAR